MPLLPRVERELTELDLSRLAREIARALKPLELILEQSNITAEQFERIKDNPIFHTRMSEEAQVWSASTRSGLRERIATKAAVAVEELLHEAVDMVQDRRLGGAARVQALQFIAKMGQLEATTKDDGTGRVTINILLGDKKLSFEKEQPVIEGEAVHVESNP
jgi:hypothetical protein